MKTVINIFQYVLMLVYFSFFHFKCTEFTLFEYILLYFSNFVIAKKVSKARYDTSLGQLTKKFLKLLSDAADGVSITFHSCPPSFKSN